MNQKAHLCLCKKSMTSYHCCWTFILLLIIMPSNQRVKTCDEIIYIPAGVEQYIINSLEFAGVSRSTIKCPNDAHMVNCGATFTLTKLFDNCTQIRPKVVVIQTAGSATSIYTTHIDSFCPGLNWYDQTNCCKSMHCSCINT